MRLIRARCCAQSGSLPRAERCSGWPKSNIDILSQYTASRTRFFHVHAIKTGHISKIYRQTLPCDIVSVSSKGTAAAQWRMKFHHENFKITLLILQVLTPKIHSNSVSAQSMRRMISMHSFSDAWASHTAKSPLQKSAITFCQNLRNWIWTNFTKLKWNCLEHFICVELSES